MKKYSLSILPMSNLEILDFVTFTSLNRHIKELTYIIHEKTSYTP